MKIGREIWMSLFKGGNFVFILILCSLFLFSTKMAFAQQTVKIGASYPLSGGVAESASYVVDGVKMAVDEINAKGGIPIQGQNLKIELFLYDSKCDPTPGVAIVEKMIHRDNVVAISGDFCSSATLAQREVSGRNKIVQVTGIAVHPKITSPDFPYMFRICNTIDMYAEPFVKFVVDNLKNIKSVGFLAIASDYGRSAAKIYTELFPKNDIKVTAVEYFKHGDTDFYTQITKILATKPDAIYIVVSEVAQNVGTLKQIKELGFKGQILGCSTYTIEDIVKLGGKELVEGIYMEAPTFELVRDRPEVRKWLNTYKEKFGREGNAFALNGYNTIQVLADAVKRSNMLTEKEKIREAMTKTDLNKVMIGYYGKLYFDEIRQTHPYLGVVQYRDGKLVPIYMQKEK